MSMSRLMEYAFTSLTFKSTKPSHLCHRYFKYFDRSIAWLSIEFFFQEKLCILLLSIIAGYCSFCIAFSCIWSICSWEISSNMLHQSLPEIIRLNFLSSGWTHLPFVNISAFIGSEGENHLHDKQFSDCHVILFNVFVVSVAVVI